MNLCEGQSGMLGSKIGGIIVQIDLISIGHDAKDVDVDGGANIRCKSRWREVEKWDFAGGGRGGTLKVTLKIHHQKVDY